MKKLIFIAMFLLAFPVSAQVAIPGDPVHLAPQRYTGPIADDFHSVSKSISHTLSGGYTLEHRLMVQYVDLLNQYYQLLLNVK